MGQLPGWLIITIASLLVLLPLIGGAALWYRLKLRLRYLPLVVLAALAVGAILAGAYMIFDMWLVARNQGHF